MHTIYLIGRFELRQRQLLVFNDAKRYSKKNELTPT